MRLTQKPRLCLPLLRPPRMFFLRRPLDSDRGTDLQSALASEWSSDGEESVALVQSLGCRVSQSPLLLPASVTWTGPSYNGFQGKRNFLACLIPIRRKQLASTRARKQNAGRAISSCQSRELLGGCRERSEVVAGVPSRTSFFIVAKWSLLDCLSSEK